MKLDQSKIKNRYFQFSAWYLSTPDVFNFFENVCTCQFYNGKVPVAMTSIHTDVENAFVSGSIDLIDEIK